MEQHQCTIHEKSVMFSCSQFNYTTPQKSNLDRHLKRHTNTPLTSNLPPKVARRDPNIIDPPAEEIQSMLDRNTQCGFGVILTDVPDKVPQFFQEEQPWGTDQNLHQVYVENFPELEIVISSIVVQELICDI